MSQVDAKQIFPSYAAVGAIAPGWLWEGLRIAAFGVWLAVAGTLFVAPGLGLEALWGLIVPLVPAILVLAPGFWRQICPLALANQTPRRLGFSRAYALPPGLQKHAFSIAVGVFLIVVSLRQLIFNKIGWATGALLLVSLLAAFLGGFVYKARSGWCGTFCPLGPIQRVYGHAPAVNIAQTYCNPCTGCQKNCYDFNPQASGFDDIYDEDPRYAGQRRLFWAMVPGFVAAYFGQGASFSYSYPLYLAILVAGPLASIGVYQFALSFLGTSPYRTASFFAGAALVIFYWFAGPIFLQTLYDLFDLTPSLIATAASRFFGLFVAASLWIVDTRNDRAYELARAEAEKQAAKTRNAFEGHEVRTSGGVFKARHAQTLLEVLVGGGLAVAANCKSGLCGSDAVLVLAGMENLSPPSDDEKSTLRRLNLPEGARLSCSVRVLGPISITQDIAAAPSEKGLPKRAPRTVETVSAERIDLALRRNARAGARLALRDRAAAAGLRRVVVVGNGIAGVTVADELRKASESLQIVVASVESWNFYNRMALNKVVEGKCAPASLLMQPERWYEDNRIEVMPDTRVASIDRVAQSVALQDGRTLDYDRLVLATGARPAMPDPSFLMHENCFVQRNVADAEALRDHIAGGGVKSAVVIGGGVLGVEAAESLRKMGLSVTILARGNALMERNIDAESAALLRRYLERLGIELRFDAQIRSYVGADRLEHVVLEDGQAVGGDVFLACIGARANVELARECGLDVGRGVLVNPLMMTTDPNIYAIGDCAELPGAQEGLWPIAVAQAQTAVAALLGEGERYVEPRMIMRLKSEGLELRSFGRIHAEADETVIVSPPFAGEWWRIVVRDNRIVGAVYAGPPGHTSPIWALVEGNVDITPHLDRLRSGALAPAAA
ncbi:MAG: FAD-dependent oxidoreductase [Rhodoblastus sp.]